jgi:hypothetical protein
LSSRKRGTKGLPETAGLFFGIMGDAEIAYRRVFTFGGLEIKFRTGKWIIEEGGDPMREEGLFYDWQKRGFLHVYSDNGRLIIDKEPCQHDHTEMVVFAA